jgi:hypothetical protein
MNIHYKSTIIYYDGIQLFDATDDNNFYYLCMLNEETQTDATYTTIKLHAYEYFNFIDGVFDLLDTINNRSIKEWYLIKILGSLSPSEGTNLMKELNPEVDEPLKTNDPECTLTLIPQFRHIPESMLPSKGFFYHI